MKVFRGHDRKWEEQGQMGGKKKKETQPQIHHHSKTTAMNILVNFRFYSFFMSKCLFKKKKTLITMKGM